MAVEQFANEAETELAADVDSGEFEIAVVSANGFPEEPQFRIRVDDELMLVHTVNGTTWGVSRDIEVTGTGLGVPHAAGAKVTHVLTAGGLLNLNPSQQTSGDALAGQVLTADGAGGSAWEDNDALTLRGLAPDDSGAADAHVVATDASGDAKVVDLAVTGGLNVGTATGAGTGDVSASGNVTAARVRTSVATTIADDAVHTITGAGTCLLCINGRSSAYDEISCIVALRAANGPFVTILTQPSNWVEASTSVLDGTTGNDTKFTVSATTDGTVYLENRTGGSVSIGYTLLG